MTLEVLFIDDDPDRHRKFKRNINYAKSPITSTHAWTYDSAVSALSEKVYDIVFFDFDLNDFPDHNTSYIAGVYGNTKLTGEDIAVAMLQLPKECWPKECVVHSMNPGGANILERLLSQAGIPTRKEEFHGRLGKHL